MKLLLGNGIGERSLVTLFAKLTPAVLCCWGILHLPVAASADDVMSNDEAKSTVSFSIVVLNVNKTTDFAQLETQFIQALQLELDVGTLQVVSVNDADFVSKNIGAQNALLRPITEQHNAMAVLWIYPSSPSKIVLQMVAVSNGRGLARVVELPVSSGIETDLAMAAKELIQTVFSFHPAASIGSAGVPIYNNDVEKKDLGNVCIEDTNDSSNSNRTNDTNDTNDTSPSALVGNTLWVSGVFSFGVAGGKGPSKQAGAVVAADWLFLQWLGVRAQYSIQGAYLDKFESGDVSGITMDFGAGIFGLFARNWFSLLPRMDMRGRLSKRTVTLDNGVASQKDFAHGYSLAVGVDSRFRFTARVGMQIGTSAVFLPENQRFQRLSSGETVLLSPHVELESRVGVFFVF